MSYDTVTSALETRLAAAAATMSDPPCNNVIAGEPTSPGELPAIAYWFAGIRDGINTFRNEIETWGWTVRVYRPIGSVRAAPRAQVEEWVATLASAIRSQVKGHFTLGGVAIDAIVTDAEAGTEDVGGMDCRTVDMTCWVTVTDITSQAA